MTLLTFIGRSAQYLSTYEIAKEMQGSRYIYEMIKMLVGTPEPFLDMDSPKYSKRNLELHPEREEEFARKLRRATVGPTYLDIVGEKGPRSWKYHFNFRGFLLYLCMESKTDRKNRRRLYSIISNPMIMRIAPFLENWQAFNDAGFDVARVLIDIGREYETQLEHDLDYLVQKVSSEYFVTLSRYFQTRDEDFLLRSNDELSRLKNYRLRMIAFLKAGLLKEIANLELAERYYRSNP